MNYLILLTSFISATAVGNAAILLNFGDTAVTGKWNNYDLNGAGYTAMAGTLNEVGIADLIDNPGDPSGISFSIADSGATGLDIFTSAATAGDYASSGLPGWFDTSNSAMRESYVWGNLLDVTYTFSGFATTDVVEFSFLIDTTTNTGDRRIAGLLALMQWRRKVAPPDFDAPTSFMIASNNRVCATRLP